MGGHHPPPLGEPHPALHLAADPARRPVAPEQGRGHREVGAVGRDDRLLQFARKAGGRAPRAKRRDGLVAVKILSRAVADGLRRVEEKAVERFDVVGDQGPLVGSKMRFDFGDDGGIIDDQFASPRVRGARPRGGRNGEVGRRSPGRPSGECGNRRADHALSLQGVSDA
jgi:hypothetical protein